MNAFQQDLLSHIERVESPDYLKSQLITYIGNKRTLLPLINEGFKAAKNALGKDRLTILDLFSGTGVVSRMARQHAHHLIANDLEVYSEVTNLCYLSNRKEVDLLGLREAIALFRKNVQENFSPGFITELYAPVDENNITLDDRVFYTRRNAIFLDTFCRLLPTVQPEYRRYILAPLLSQASMKTNTSGVFKGFYKNKAGIGQFGGEAKNALSRILADIEINEPILSSLECSSEVFREDANKLVKNVGKVDVAYFDPPYNQHPYGSNYFMLNLISDYRAPQDLSRVSGIPKNWNRSPYNKPNKAEEALFSAISDCRASFVLISYNSEGFIPHETFLQKLEKMGNLSVLDQEYNTFRGCRNLRNRDTYVTEFLYLLDRR